MHAVRALSSIRQCTATLLAAVRVGASACGAADNGGGSPFTLAEERQQGWSTMPAAEAQPPPGERRRRPHFFKVLVGDFKQRLKVPPNFCKHIPWEASRKAKSLKESSMAATLEGPSGRTWLVVIRRTAEGTFFTSGWPKFVRDQALSELEFLVFRYEGSTHFTVMVFDTTACEREDLLAGGGGGEPRPRKKRGGARTAASNRKGSDGKELVPYRAPRGGQQQHVACSDRTSELRSAGQHGASVKTEVEAEQLPLCVIPAASRRPAAGNDQTNGNGNGAGGVGSSPAKKRCVATAVNKTRGIQDDDLAAAAADVDIPPSVRRYRGYVSRRRPVTAAERQRATEIAHAFRSPLPYCVIRMSTMHVYYSFMMRFPTGFSRQHLPRERTEVVLRDPRGKEWEVLYIPNTRDRLSRGWCAFARGNCLEEGDCCVFELVAAAEFRVHIFRVADPPVPAVRLRRA